MTSIMSSMPCFLVRRSQNLPRNQCNGAKVRYMSPPTIVVLPMLLSAFFSNVDANNMDLHACNEFLVDLKILLNKIELENLFDHFASSATRCGSNKKRNLPSVRS